MLRTPQHVSPEDHPECIAFVEGNRFEDFLLNAAEMCERKDRRIMLWQNPNVDETVSESAIPDISSTFKIHRRKTHHLISNKERMHLDKEIQPITHDPDKIFEDRILRVSEQLQGKTGTSFYYVDLKNTQLTDLYNYMTTSRKALLLTEESPYYGALQGPFSLLPGQAGLILSRAFGYLATPHGFAISNDPSATRATLLTDIEPLVFQKT